MRNISDGVTLCVCCPTFKNHGTCHLCVVELRSSDFGLPMVRGRLYFVGAELFSEDGETATGNSHATLDRVYVGFGSR